MNKFKQEYKNDCLLACFRYVCFKFHNKYIKYDDIHYDLDLNNNGIDLYTGEEYSKFFGLTTESYKVNNIHELEKYNILLINKNQRNHFVVLISSKKEKIKYFDPDEGIILLSKQEFLKKFYNVIMIPTKSSIINYQRINGNEKIHMHIDVIAKNILLGALLVVFQLLILSYFQVNLKYTLITGEMRLLYISAILTCLFIIVSSIISIVIEYFKTLFEQRVFVDGVKKLLLKCKNEDISKGDIQTYINSISKVCEYKSYIHFTIFTSLINVIVFSILTAFINYQILLVIVFFALIKYMIKSYIVDVNEPIIKEAILRTNEVQNWINTIICDKNKIINHGEWDWFYKKISNRFVKLASVNIEAFNKTKYITLLQLIGDKLFDICVLLIGLLFVINNTITIETLFIISFIYKIISSKLVDILNYKEITLKNKIATNELALVENINVNELVNISEIKSIKLQEFSNNKLFKPISKDIDGWVDIKGPNGVGKSVLVNAIKNNKNRINGILINGFENYLIEPKCLDRIVIVSESDLLYCGTVKKEIMINNKNKFDANYLDNMEIDECKQIINHGSNFSSGQIQIINLIKCLHKDFDVLILDESLSNIDKRYKEYLIRLIKRLCKDKIVINISHEFELSKNIIEVKKWNT